MEDVKLVGARVDEDRAIGEVGREKRLLVGMGGQPHTVGRWP